MEEFEEESQIVGFAKKWGVELVLAGLGAVMMILGLAEWRGDGGDRVEIVSANESDERDMMVVIDVAGAVMNPGMVEVEDDSRVGGAIERAGGFREEADWDYVAEKMNLAMKVSDGQKIYVPFAGEEVEDTGGEEDGVVNANSASQSVLESLWGIGSQRAIEIIENRPYASLEELKEKAKIPENVLERNRDKLVVM